MKRTGVLIIAFVIGLIGAGCSDPAPKDDSSASPKQVVTVQVAQITARTLPVILKVDGSTDVTDRGTVVSPVDGTIVELSAEIGTRVRAGDTLGTVRTRESEASLRGAQRLVAAARTPQEQDEAKRALKVARENQVLIPLIAEHPGVVVEKNVSVGQVVTANASLLTLVDLSTLNFIARVPIGDLHSVNIGQACVMTFPSMPDHKYDGKVVAVSAQSDLNSQTVPVRIRFTSLSSHLRDIPRTGMMGVARITIDKHVDVLTVPAAALLRNDLNDTYRIFTVSADSLAQEIPVKVGILADSLAEVSSPSLKAGEAVIVNGNYEVSDSMRVSVENASAR